MKKKVFSLMMTLLLAFVGVAKAELVEVGVGGTTTNSYLPCYTLYNNTLSEQIYTADEIGTAGTINSIAFYNGGSEKTPNFKIYMVNTTQSDFATTTSWLPVTANDLVYTGNVTLTAGAWTTITLDAPFEYDGTSNLGLIVDENMSWSSGVACRVFDGASNCSMYVYSDGTDYNAVGATYTASNRVSVKNQLQLDITPAGGGGGGFEDKLHVKYMDGEEEVIDSLNMGVRPANAWMEPFTFTMYSEGPNYTVNVLDFTPSDGMFSVSGEELPFQVTRTQDVELTLACNGTEAGLIERQFVAITEGNRAAHIWPVVVELYTPMCPDVWELACEEATEFPFVEVPQTAHSMELHNDYTLPFPEIPEGYDAVYKLVFDEDVMLNASVTAGANGKVALYREGFEGEGGPMAHNYYTGPSANGGGATGGSFEAMIGDETSTSTSTYAPFHTLWNYSLSECLYLASELTEAGVTTAPMTSLSYYVSSTSCSTPQNNISIWMGNVSDAELTSTTHPSTGMTLVYTGNDVLPVAGEWNEFEFNAGNFAWDGHSNVVILCQRNNGTYQGIVSWQSHNPGFTGMIYHYSDTNGGYDASVANTGMYTSSTNRPNIIFKANGRATVNNLTYNFEGGVTGWTNIDNDGDGNTWFHSSNSEAISGYVYTGLGNNASDGFMVSASYSDLTYEAIDADNYLVSPQKYTLGDNASVNFFFDYGSDSYPDYFEVCVATANNPGANDFTSIWSVDMRGNAEKTAIRHSNNRYENWREVTVDLSAYAGQDVWIAFHHEDYDQYELWIDDVVINTGSTEPTPGPEPTPAGEMAYGPEIVNAAVEAGTYYLVASSTDADLEVTINAEDMPCPMVEAEGFVWGETPADDADGVEPGSVTLRWNIPAYATGWRLVFGSTYYPDPNHPQTIMYPEDGSFATELANSYTVTNLWNNTNYFWHVEFNNDGCPEGVSSPIWGFTTHLNIPQNLTAVDYTVFDDEQIVLNWTAVVDRTYRFYNVYRDGELIGNTQVNNISNTTYTDGPLAYNMSGYTYYVTAVYDEGESAPSDPVTVKVSGYGDVNGHVYEQDGETGIAGATVTMVGQDEFGVNHTYNFTTNNQGYYSGHIYAGSYNGSASCPGYQTVNAPVQGNPIPVVYNETASPYDYILDENFDPVCQVIAEYYPDSLDPESPYVKVYWGCGLPGSEIIEPFETGDFSLFDWQLDPTYPWSITTTNPYEGTYCMKSGGAGVANVVSNMTVTVEIPADGLMSFWGKISCESNWDYGYFYIDGVQKGSYTGASSWAEKTFDITAGTHTFQWRYTKDSSVNSNDDCFYVDYITFYKQPAPAIPGMTYDFEDGTMQGWTSVDADGDGYGWYMGSEIMTGQTGNGGSSDFVLSQSYYLGTVLYPDNYLVSPQVQLGGIVRFYACAQDASYAAEHFGLAVSTTNTNPSSFTMVQEWTMTAKSVGDNNGKPVKGSRSGRAQGNWYEYTVDLSSYSGMGYVAIRHFNCSDMFYLNVDDITIGEPGKGLPTNDRAFSHYRVYRTDCYNDGPYTLLDEAHGYYGNTRVLACELHDTVYIDVSWPDAAPGVYKWGVGCVYVGNRGEEIAGPIHWAQPTNGNRATLDYNFDDNTMQGWTNIDADGDGNVWVSSSNPGIYHNSGVSLSGTGHNSSEAYVISGSYANQTGQVLYPDNYLVSPQIALGGSITFYACAQDASYAAEHFGVAVSTTSNTSASAFTTVQEWTLSAKGTGSVSYGREGNNRAQGNWYQYTVDLSAYSGMGYVAIRHFNCHDQFILNVDDITIVEGAGGPTPGPTPTPGEGDLQEPRESEIVWSNCLDKDMYLSDVDVNVLLNSADSPEGTVVTLTNLNEYEQGEYPVAPVTLDETGFYAWESFRKGEYAVKVEHEGYEPIADTVSIWSETHLRYVMTEILYGVSNVYVSRTGWAMWDGAEVPVNPQPGPGGNTTFSDDFESGLNNWTLVDADADGHNWYHSSLSQTYSCYDYTGWGHNGSDGFAVSQSYTDCTYDSYDPNNFMITNQKYSIVAGSTLNFWADYGNDSYPDHFGVAVATADNPTPADFTVVWEGSAKNGNASKSQIRHEGDRYFNWRSHSVDLSAYAGQNVYIAFRHFNSYDQYEIYIDDVELTAGAKSGDRHLEYYKVMCTSIDGVPIFNHNTVHPFCQLSTDEPYNAPLVEGEHYLCKVACVYTTGMSAWSEPVEWEYEACDHWGPVDEVTATTTNEGNHIEWVFDHGYNPYGGNTPGPGGNASTFTQDFEGGLNDWTVIDGNNDGWTWCLTSAIPSTWTYYASLTLDWYHGGSNAICSGSYINGVGALTPNEYLVSPQVTLAAGSQLSFWVAATDASYPADHFGVCVSDNGTSDWTMVQEWTLTAKKSGLMGGSASRNGEGLRLGTWYNYTVDLSAYAGQKYIAFRHFNCTDQYIMCLDDIELTAPAKGGLTFTKGGEFYTQYAEDGVMLNFYAMDNVDLRAYMLYVLSNDRRFSLVPEDEYGQFILTSMTNANDFMSEFESVYQNAIADFSLLSKVDIDGRLNEWKNGVSPTNLVSVMMDVLTSNNRPDNDHCINSLPFCTSEMITFQAANTNNTANEPGMDQGCIGSSYNPSFYHMRIHTAGPFVIHMEGHDPDTQEQRDIDFCMWGPYTEQEVISGTACSSLTGDKIMDCCYSAYYSEDCYLGYAEGQHQHNTSHGNINYHVPEVGEYYILMITNFSRQPCVINFTKTEGEGETDCEIVTPTDIIGFLITEDGEYVAFADANAREYTVEGEFGEHDYCVRPIYPGEMTLPDHNYGWSMGCPVCASTNGGQGCAPVTDLTGTIEYHETYGPGVLLTWEGNANSYTVSIGTQSFSTTETSMFLYGITSAGNYTFNVVAVYDDCESDPETVSVYYDDVIEVEDNVSLYPNPTNGNVTIEAKGLNRITVVTLLGQVVYDAEVSNDKVTLNMSQFNAGMYMVRVSTESGVVVKRVTVMQ